MLSPRRAAQAGLASALLLFGTCLALLANGAVRDRNLLRQQSAAPQIPAVAESPKAPSAVPQTLVSRQPLDSARPHILHRSGPTE
jgi:hypothetical protein